MKNEKDQKKFNENLTESVDKLSDLFGELRTSSDIYKLKHNIVSLKLFKKKIPEIKENISETLFERFKSEILLEMIINEVEKYTFDFIYKEILNEIIFKEKEFSEFSREQETLIDNVLNTRNKSQIVVSGFNVDLTADNVQCLR
jgi:hypothetical protein